MNPPPMDAQLLISDIRAIRITRVHERPGHRKFVRVITVRYGDESEYEICLSADDPRTLELLEEDPPAR